MIKFKFDEKIIFINSANILTAKYWESGSHMHFSITTLDGHQTVWDDCQAGEACSVFVENSVIRNPHYVWEGSK